MGVIERVPFGEPVEWCHRMVMTRKHDGSPRRTVDLSPLNKHCQRETHNSESPFHLARRIPRNTWKTVTDAWNGYHSVPLRKSDLAISPRLSPRSVDGGMHEHHKDSSRLATDTIVDSMQSLQISTVKSELSTTHSSMTRT